MKKKLLFYKSLVVLFFTCFSLLGQEICDNGIDDDADNLIDLNDPDCDCQNSSQTVEVTSLIPNPSFENHSNCPDSFSQLHFLNDWNQATLATSDFFHTCGFEVTNILPAKDKGYVGGATTGENYKEYIGANLTTPIPKNESFTLKCFINSGILDIGASSQTINFDGNIQDKNFPNIKITLYGKSTITNFPLNTYIAPDQFDSNWIILGTFDYKPKTIKNSSNWDILEITFTSTTDIKSVIIGPPPTLPPNSIGLNSLFYYLLDDLRLNKTSIFNQNNSAQINESGDFCQSTKSLSASFEHTPDNSTTYQWYKDGIAIQNETSNTLSITNSGKYAVRIHHQNNCYHDEKTIENTDSLPKPSFTKTDASCNSNTGSITITSTTANNTMFSFDGGTTWQNTNFKDNLSPGNHTIKIKNDICESEGNQVIINESEQLQDPTFIKKDTTCGQNNGSISINTNIGGQIQFSFDGGTTWQTSNTKNNLSAGTYLIKLKSGTCLSNTITVNINNSAIGETISIDSITLLDWNNQKNGFTIHLSNSTNTNYLYSLDNSTFQEANTFTPLEAGVYTVYIKDPSECHLITETVYLLDYMTFFTPNSDNFNDEWQIILGEKEQTMEVRIFDRYGRFIKQFFGSGSWDGTFNGQKLPSSDFWFYVLRQDKRIHKGHFTLKR